MGIGTLLISTKDYDEDHSFLFEDVLYVTDKKNRLLSPRKTIEHGLTIKYGTRFK